MLETDRLEVWNLTPGGNVVSEAQRIHNIVGRLKSPASVSRFTYTLNGGPEREIFFNPTPERSGRLQNLGDFNLDTIEASELLPRNCLLLRLYDRDGSMPGEMAIDFTHHAGTTLQPLYSLNPGEFETAEQAGQVVDGQWRLGRDERGEACLEVRPQDAGYDRIILFGHRDWTSGYEISARLCVTEWTHKVHNVGLLFKWNPHLQGDGSHLPVQWSTGLAYYYSRSAGLRLRVGVDVHFDQDGQKVGDEIMGEAPLSRRPWAVGRLRRLLRRVAAKLGAGEIGGGLPALQPGIHYRFHLRLHPELYELTVWPDNPGASQALSNHPPRRPQVIARRPVDRLPHGCVGVIAYHCALRVYEYNVSPLNQSRPGG